MGALFTLMTKVPNDETRRRIMEASVRLVTQMEREANNYDMSCGEREIFYSTVVEGIQETRRMLPIDGPVPVECRDV